MRAIYCLRAIGREPYGSVTNGRLYHSTHTLEPPFLKKPQQRGLRVLGRCCRVASSMPVSSAASATTAANKPATVRLFTDITTPSTPIKTVTGMRSCIAHCSDVALIDREAKWGTTRTAASGGGRELLLSGRP
jgi:hypothetical protein